MFFKAVPRWGQRSRFAGCAGGRAPSGCGAHKVPAPRRAAPPAPPASDDPAPPSPRRNPRHQLPAPPDTVGCANRNSKALFNRVKEKLSRK